MKTASCNRILQAYEELFAKMGLNFKQGLREYRQWGREAMKLWDSPSVHAFKAKLLKLPEPSEQEMEATLAAIKLIPYLLKKPLSEAAKKLPSPPGGRPRLMTPEQCQEACAQIGSLLGQGVELSDALQRMASHYGVRLRTMQRVWQKRARARIQLET